MMDDLRDLYQEVILDHGKNPRNFRHPDDCNRQAEGDNPLCGDQLAVYLKLNGEGMVEDVAFQGRGCAISMASASMMTEMVQGRSEADARALFAKFHKLVTGTDDEVDDDEDLDKLIVLSGVREFPMRVKCATLAWHTMTAAMDGDDTVTTE
ncbi:MAG: SUF system NifU family Fe-S cluster assembly protein [Alphaproteobacteria bacterium]|nr:SUF system NifU family Fe-S cluster assembly protein [Rhodospirillaceae bacterium]MBT7612062.1 SUF system NifU family Fe-S cluster assembly protein [Rhodospirillaceae bacterium]MBT7648468.1 SUF system NifU family Fe-S cluster assembly protein [Rhodospirillaceae bacterium]MDG2482282.1 SUF system NifU family Fe-S cluster assembly protein [Alphaproteobacteria bacterium]